MMSTCLTSAALFRSPRYCSVICRYKVTGSSKAWLQRHVNDPYVKMAEKDNNRSRAAYKLQDIQDKHKLIKANDFVIDLGAAPGGWSVIVSNMLKFSTGHGLLVSIDLLPMEPIPTEPEDSKYVHFIQGNFNSVGARQSIDTIAAGHPAHANKQADVILSDMLQNTTGHATTDHLKSMNLCYAVLEFSQEYLKPGGNLLCKYFQGSDDRELLDEAKKMFKSTKLVKPKSSRSESREMYLLAMNKFDTPSA